MSNDKDEVTKLNDIVDMKMTGSISKFSKEDVEDGECSKLSVIKVKDIQNGIITSKTIDVVKVDISEKSRYPTLLNGDVVISVSGSFKAAIVDESVEGAAISSNLVALRLSDKIKPESIVSYLNSVAGQKELIRYSTGTALQKLSIKNLLDIPLTVPPMEE